MLKPIRLRRSLSWRDGRAPMNESQALLIRRALHLFIHRFTQPNEIYIADSMATFADARPITSFNRLFTERDLPQGKPYRLDRR